MSPVVAFTPSHAPVPEELDEVFREHSRLIYRAAHSVMARPEDAEDVVQALFLQALAPAPQAQVEAGLTRAYERIQSPGARTASAEADDAPPELRRVSWLRPAVTIAAAAAVIALSIWIGVSTREEAIAVLEAADLSLFLPTAASSPTCQSVRQAGNVRSAG
jgi:hypothetical protein